MVSQTIRPQNREEALVWYAITGTYLFYLMGALYIIGPALGWTLFALVAGRYLRGRDSGTALARIPFVIAIWVTGMLVLLAALVVGHADFALGWAKMIKSSIGWAKGWALFGVFLVTACLSIRAELIYRAAMHVCLHTLLVMPLLVIAWLVGAPQTLYVSPLQILGGPGPEFFSVSLYEVDPGSGLPRWRIFTPWAPALGFLGNIYFQFALNESDLRWKSVGIVASILMILMSGSRLAQIALIVLICARRLMPFLRSEHLSFAIAGACVVAGIVAVPIMNALERFWEMFRAARAGSSRVREALARIAYQRWIDEAVYFGHGIVERGPHLVEFMPIGSHHTWLGLLFVKGLVGLFALAIPMIFSLVAFLVERPLSQLGKTGFSVLLIFGLYSFGENLEILAYLIWPSVIVLGLAHREMAEIHS